MPKSSITPSKARSARSTQLQPEAPREVYPSAMPAPSAVPTAGEAPEPSLAGRDGERPLPSHEDIAARAYVLSMERQNAGREGDEMSDWLRAEAEILSRSR